MFTTWKLTIASLKMFVRNKQAVFFTLVMPLIIMTIFGVIGFDRPPQYDIGVVLEGNNAPSKQQMLAQLRSVPVFNLHYGNEMKERQAIREGDRAIVIFLGNNPRSLTVLSNAGSIEAQTALSIINQMVDKATLAQAQVEPAIAISVEEINSNNLKYIDFLLPGLVALSVMQLSVFSIAFVFVDFKEKGILKRVIATPVKPYQFVIANIITRLLVAVIQAGLFIVIGVTFFDVTIIGSYWLIALVVLLGALMFLGLGFAISGWAKTVESVPALANLIVFPMFFLGGVFFAVSSMPQWLQYIAQILPLTFFSTALRDIMTQGAEWSDIYMNIVWMAVWAVILVGLAISTFRFDDGK